MLIEDYQYITASDLKDLDDTVLVYDENSTGTGTKGTRYTSNCSLDKVHGFITFDKFDKSKSKPFARPFPLGAYIEDIYQAELNILVKRIVDNPNKLFCINPLGLFIDSGMVFFHCIRPRLPEDLKNFDNVMLLWNNIPDYASMMYNELIPTSYVSSGSEPQIPYYFLQMTGNTVDINRLNNKHIPVFLKNGVYVERGE